MSRLPAQLPEDFYVQPMPLPEAAEFPVGISPDSAGRLFLWDKAGTVWVRDTSGNWDDVPLVDIREEVSNWYDLGLMGFALDYQFEENGYFYLLYALDLHHYYHFGTPQYHPDSTVTESATIGRVVRYQAELDGPFPRLQPGSRHVLMGANLADGIPILYGTHAIGALLHSPDSTLLVSCGEVTSWQGWDTGGDEYGTLVSEGLAKGIITEAEDVGSYRAQFRGSLNGKILRIDSHTGAGVPSNPFYQPEAPRAAPSRVWALGLRNPYRMTLVPGSSGHRPAEGRPGHLLVGDVGSVKFEELNRVSTGGQNFGWPITEGFGTVWEFLNQPAPYNALAPRPEACGSGFLDFRQTLVRANRQELLEKPHPCLPNQIWSDTSLLSLETPPLIAWSSLWNALTRAHVPGFDDQDQLIGRTLEEAGLKGEPFLGYSSLSGAFYSGTRFPEPYRDCFFLADYFGWIRALRFDEDGEVAEVLTFHEEADQIIHLTYAPREEALYYLDVNSQLFRITYGGEVPPIARIQADTVYGGPMLAVQFDGRASTHPKHPIATYH
jgi:glucose/arabinose dehydrogenase